MTNRIQLWSCGGGRQSVLILGLIKDGRLPKPDHTCMVDTNRERSSTWRYVNAVIRPELECMDISFTVIDRSRYATVELWGGADGQSCLIPGYTSQTESGGKLPEWCSGEWKREVVIRWSAEQEGWKAKGVDMWLGISYEERHRRRGPKRNWIQPTYPLLDVCPSHVSTVYDLCGKFGWPDPVRSCCWMCPNMGNAEWRSMRDEDPDDFAMACELDKEIRKRDPHIFVHRDKVPLAMADLGTEDPPGLFGGCTSGMCY